MKRPFELDVSELPTHAFGPRMTTWWGTLGFIVLEGTGFALASAAYLFLWLNNPDWPLDAAPPPLLWSTLVLVVMLASLWPNMLVESHARAYDLAGVRRDLVILVLIGLLLVVLRSFEFAALAFVTVGVSLKLALFPLHTWLPNAYAYAPSWITAFLAATAGALAEVAIPAPAKSEGSERSARRRRWREGRASSRAEPVTRNALGNRGAKGRRNCPRTGPASVYRPPPPPYSDPVPRARDQKRAFATRPSVMHGNGR